MKYGICSGRDHPDGAEIIWSTSTNTPNIPNTVQRKNVSLRILLYILTGSPRM